MAAEPEPKTVSREPILPRIRKQLFWAGWIGNAVGAVLVFNLVGSLIPVFLDPDDRWALGWRNGPVVALFVLAGGLFSRKVLRGDVDEALNWIDAGREPDPREHRLALRLPLYLAKAAAGTWAISAPIFFAINAPISVGFAAVAAVTIVLGGLTNSALIYLQAERILRPATARALAARLPAEPAAPGVRGRLMIAWALGTGIPLLGLLILGIIGVAKSDVDAQYVAAAGITLTSIALAVGLAVTIFAARAIADPVTSVRAGLERVESGDLEAQVRVDDGSEVGLLQAGFNRMAEGLREREQLRDLFGRQVGKDVAQAALEQGTRLGGEEREIAALFVDLVGSTSMALRMPPEEVVALLNRFFAIVVDVVEAEGGFVNKFEGDAALCVFGAPLGATDPAGDALRAARRLARRLSDQVPEVDFGIGVSAGRAVAGNIGAEQRFEYTVIGDPVNEAARLCELAKQHRRRVLASEAALGLAADGERASWTVGKPVTLRGRDEPTPLASPAAP